MVSPPRPRPVLLPLLWLMAPARSDSAASMEATDAHNATRPLAVNRLPALYTGDFGDCLGKHSLFNTTRFDAGLYTDNLTIVFHLAASTTVRHESLMVQLTMETFGQPKYALTLDPCVSGAMAGLCPVNANGPIVAWAALPVSEQVVLNMSTMAYVAPDLEGTARLRIWANSSQTEIGCFQAVVNNGKTLALPQIIPPVLGALTLLAMLASLVTAVYGVSLMHTRMHYAHSLSVLVMVETFQAFFFSGALNLHLPRPLVAWYSNFAWSAGIIHQASMVRAVNGFVGIRGNASQAGGAGLVSQMHGPSPPTTATPAEPRHASAWPGAPVAPALPLPGTCTGLAATLAEVDVASEAAFMVALVWYLVALGLVVVGMMIARLVVEGLVRAGCVEADALAFFRSHWKPYTATALLRSLLVMFGALLALAMCQLAMTNRAGPTVVAAVVLVVFVAAVAGPAALACRSRTRGASFQVVADALVLHRVWLFKAIPWLAATRSSLLEDRHVGDVRPMAAVRFFRIRRRADTPGPPPVHEDRAYITRFGWLSARYRGARWWFFVYHLGYHFVRACFLAGASNLVLAQVYGLFVLELVSFVLVAQLDPFESSRNTVMAVWMLGLAKVLTSGLSIAFLPAFGHLDRVSVAAIGFAIIAVQALTLIGLAVLVLLDLVSTCMSLSRNRSDFPVVCLDPVRVSYLEHIQTKAPDSPDNGGGAAQKNGPTTQPPRLGSGSFSVKSVWRAPKIEDEDHDLVADLPEPPRSRVSSVNFEAAAPARQRPRASSANSQFSATSLPRAARVHRASWSSRDFSQCERELGRHGRLVAQRLNAASVQKTSPQTLQVGRPMADGHDGGMSTPAFAAATAPAQTPNLHPSGPPTSFRLGATDPGLAVSAGPSLAAGAPLATWPTTPSGLGSRGGPGCRLTMPTRETLAQHAADKWPEKASPPPTDAR